MNVSVSGHLGPQDVMLLADETTDQQSYLERTLPSLIKLAFQNLAKNDGLLLLSQVELEKLDSQKGMSRYLIEPVSTYEARTRVVYTGGARKHNISGIVKIQRLCSREQFCPRATFFPQERCSELTCGSDGKSGCLTSMSQVDGGHNNLSLSDKMGSTALNAAVSLRL